MSKVNARSYFAKLAEQGATHSIRLAKAHAARHAVLSKGKALFSKAAKKAEGMADFSDVSDWIDELVEQEAEMRDANTDAGEFFTECMKACKAMADDGLEKATGMTDADFSRSIVPDIVGGIASANFHPVARFGQPPISRVEDAPVAAMFEKLVSIDEG